MPRGRSCSISTRPRSRTSSSSAPRRPWRGSCSPSSWSSRSSSFGCSAVIRNTDVRRRVDGARVVLTAALLALAVLWLLPIGWVLVTSLKTTAETVKVPPEGIPWPATGAHYHAVLLGSSRTARTRRALPHRIVVPVFRSAWNDFLWPLIAVNKPDMFPLPVALALLRSAYSSESYGPIMAGAALSALPLFVVFLVANRRIVEGVRLSGLKG